jgi:hypothetical protein
MLFLILLVGTHFSQCIASIQHQVGTIKGVEISYCDRNPLAFDLSIRLTQDGIKLVFDSLSQRLKVIEIYDLSLVRLKYWQVIFLFGPASGPRFLLYLAPEETHLLYKPDNNTRIR